MTTGYHVWFHCFFSSPSLSAVEDESDDSFGSDDADEDDDASSSGDDEMTA